MNKAFTYILGIIILAVVLYGGYSYFFSGTADTGELLSRTQTNSIASGQEFLATLLRLKEINLTEQKSFLSDNTFRSLKDSSVILPEEPEGRVNPFLPIGKEAQPVVPLTPQTSGASQDEEEFIQG